MKKVNRTSALNLSWDEIGFICEGMSFAARPIFMATQSITDEFSLGPRGAWMVRLISRGQVYPLDLAKVFHIGRSLITAELTRLTDAGLVIYQKSEEDGRKVELTLTPLGEQVNRRVKQELNKLISERLSSYKREEILLCARLLHDFRVPVSVKTEQTHAISNVTRAIKKKSRSRRNQVASKGRAK